MIQSASGRPAPFGTTAPAGPVGPPTWLLAIGLVLPVAALPLTFVSSPPAEPGAVHINLAWLAGWLIAVFGSVIPLAVFTREDLRRRLSRWYVDRPGLLGVLRVAVLVVGLLVAAWFAYLIADEVARWEIWF